MNADLHSFQIELKARARPLAALPHDQRREGVLALMQEIDERRDPNWVVLGLRRQIAQIANATEGV